MQKWPYAELAHIDVQYFRSVPKKNDPGQKWEHLTVEAVFVSEDAVMEWQPTMKLLVVLELPEQLE